MKNHVFEIDFDKEYGGIQRLSLVGDNNKMNFCREGRIMSVLRQFSLVAVEERETSAIFTHSCFGAEAVTSYCFEDESLLVSMVLTNKNNYPLYFSNGDICLEMPFNDAYEASDVCMKERCHTHIWAGLENSYIRTERMGESEYNIGLAFEKGSVYSYRQEDCKHCHRGHFALNIEAFTLLSGESYEIVYRIFRHKGRADFFEHAKAVKGFLQVKSKKGYSFFEGEEISFEILANEAISVVDCNITNQPCICKIENNRAVISFTPQKLGEYEVIFNVNDRRGKAVFNVLRKEERLIKTRIDFIIRNQQCTDKNSPLCGAYLIYDNEEERQYFDYFILDHNANRERMGMSLTIVKWLQTHNDEEVRKSLDLFTEFLLRECVDEEKGTCYGNIGKDDRYLRLYNAPWVALYFSELYNLTKDVRWANLLVRILRYYYGVGGAKFYPNGIRFYTFYQVMKDAGLRDECAEIYELFNEHVKTIVTNGVLYPPHEVNFEQTIVTPAVTILLDKYAISKEEFYLKEAEKHLHILQKFDGLQPHYRMYNIPIRFWDDYFFGKYGSYGDVFPHYWSILSGYGYYLYGKLAKDAESLERARQCILNCFCNIYPDGRATCSYIFPEWVSGTMRYPEKEKDWIAVHGLRKGAYANVFANDQDFALYFWQKMQQDKKSETLFSEK